MTNENEIKEQESNNKNLCSYNIPFEAKLLNESQKESINKFRSLLTKEENKITLEVDIIRFLAAREWNVDQAVKMRKENIKIRKNWQIDRYHIDNDFNNPRFKSVQVLRKLFGAGINNGCFGKDKSGNPVCYSFFGSFINLPLYKYISIDEYLKWHISNFEALIKNQMNKCNSSQFLMIMDLDHLGLESRHNSHFIRACSKFNATHYPEYFYKVLCINAPKIVQILYQLVKPMIPERTRDKVSFYDHYSTPKIMQSYIDKQYLSQRYGGDVLETETQCFSKVSENPEKLLKDFRTQSQLSSDIKLQKINMKPGENTLLTFDVEQESIIRWFFMVSNGDILFQVRWKENDMNEWIVIRHEARVGNEGIYGKLPVYDEFKADKSGKIEFEFSNKHSSFKSKSVNYYITID